MSHSSASPSHFLVQPLARALRGATTVPGDKSIGHRAVLFAGLAEGQSHLRGLSGGEDNQRTVAALCALGATAGPGGPGELFMTGRGLGGLQAPAADIDCGNSGTSIRLLCGLLAAQPFASRLVGDPYLHARPMRRVADPLRRMGASIEGEPGSKPGQKLEEIYPPLRVQGGPLRAIRFESPIASAQVKSAVLLAGLYAEGVTTVVEPTRSRDHSERMLRALGVPLRVEDERTCSLDPGGWDRRLRPFSLTIPGDLSSAAFLLGAALLSPGSDLRITGVGLNPSRTGILDVLATMAPGAVTVEDLREEMGEPVGTLRARGPAGLLPVRIGGALAVRALDELPLCAALCALAPGESVISDAAELRVKESDRIAATAALLRAFGVACEERPDGLVVQGRGPGGLQAARVQSFGDHRIAMAGATLALAGPGESRVDDVGNVATSFPTFAAALGGLGAEIAEVRVRHA